MKRRVKQCWRRAVKPDSSASKGQHPDQSSKLGRDHGHGVNEKLPEVLSEPAAPYHGVDDGENADGPPTPPFYRGVLPEHITVIEHRDRNEYFAKKTLGDGQGPQATREIEIMQQLSHDNILPLVQTHRADNGELSIITKLAESSLFDKIQVDGHLPEDVCRRYFSQLVAGIKHCHEMGIAHLDLKTENVLMTGETLLIADFGHARFLHTPLTEYLGSIKFMAPEILNRGNSGPNAAYCGRAADMWSLGVILRVMLTRTFPIGSPDSSHMEDVSAMLSGALNPLPEHVSLSPQVHDLLQRLLDNDPSQRPSCSDVERHAWLTMGSD